MVIKPVMNLVLDREMVQTFNEMLNFLNVISGQWMSPEFNENLHQLKVQYSQQYDEQNISAKLHASDGTLMVTMQVPDNMKLAAGTKLPPRVTYWHNGETPIGEILDNTDDTVTIHVRSIDFIKELKAGEHPEYTIL